MLSLRKVQTQVARGQWGAIVDAVLRNGRPVPVAVRLRLTEGGSICLAALALAVRRAVELTYGVAPEVGPLVNRLAVELSRPRSEGGADPSLAAVAIAMGALQVALEHAAVPGDPAAAAGDGTVVDREAAETALAIGAYRLHEAHVLAQHAARVAGRPASTALIGAHIDTAVLLGQLAEVPGLEARVAPPLRTAELRRAAARAGLWALPDCGALLEAAGLREPLLPRTTRAA